MTFDDTPALKTLSAGPCEGARQEPPLMWDLRLDEMRTLDLPPEALAFELMIYDESGVPSPNLLLEFAQALLAVSGVTGAFPHRKGMVLN